VLPCLQARFLLGQADACAAHGLKQAAEELRLQLPRRQFHGIDAALRSEKQRDEKKAEEGISPPLESQVDAAGPAEQLTAVLRAVPVPQPPAAQAAKDRLDRGALWSTPSNIGTGDLGPSTNGGIV